MGRVQSAEAVPATGKKAYPRLPRVNRKLWADRATSHGDAAVVDSANGAYWRFHSPSTVIAIQPSRSGACVTGGTPEMGNGSAEFGAPSPPRTSNT